MNKNDYIIRLERQTEQRKVGKLVREVFWNVYRPGYLERYVLNRLRNNLSFIPQLNYVMEKDGILIGQNVFVNAVVKDDTGKDIPVATMGPICIDRNFQRMGYGKALLDYTLDRAKKLWRKSGLR